MLSLAQVAAEVFLRIDQGEPGTPNLTKAGVYEIGKAFVDVQSQALAAGEDVSLPGFGKFKITTRAARKGHNPQTGKKIDIPEKQVVKFAPAMALKEAVAGTEKAEEKPKAKKKAKGKKKK